MAGNNNNSGSVFMNWHDSILQNLTKVQLKGIYELGKRPRFPDYITEPDIYSIENIAERFDVDISEYDLKKPREYKKAKGKIEAKIDKILFEDLKPQDPFVEMMENENIDMNEQDIDNQIGDQ